MKCVLTETYNCKKERHLATVNLEICPKVNDRYIIFGNLYEVIDVEHDVRVTGSDRTPMVVEETLKCGLTRIV